MVITFNNFPKLYGIFVIIFFMPSGVTRLQVNTNYINLARFMMYFILRCEQNGWMTVGGTPVKKQVLIRELYDLTRFMNVKWVNKSLPLICSNYNSII